MRVKIKMKSLPKFTPLTMDYTVKFSSTLNSEAY